MASTSSSSSSSSTSSPPPPWLILSKVTRVVSSDASQGQEAVSLLPSRPISYLTVVSTTTSNIIRPPPPRVLAADLSAGLFLVTNNPDTLTLRVLDVASSPAKASAVVFPADGLEPGTLGVISAADDRGGFMVLGIKHQLHGRPLPGLALLHRYCSYSNSKEYILNDPLVSRQGADGVTRHNYSDVIAHNGRLWWWVDAATSRSAALLSWDPFAAADDDNPPRFAGTPLPVPSDRSSCSHCSSDRMPIAARRRLQVVNAKFRWVQMLCAHMMTKGAPVVHLVTLGDNPVATVTKMKADNQQLPPGGENHLLSLADLWASPTYKDTGLPEEEPALAFIHPYDISVVYLVLRGHLFGVHLLNKEVVPGSCQPHHMPQGPDDVSAAASLIAWVPPPSLWGLLAEPPAPPPPPPPPQAATGEASGSGGVHEN